MASKRPESAARRIAVGSLAWSSARASGMGAVAHRCAAADASAYEVWESEVGKRRIKPGERRVVRACKVARRPSRLYCELLEE